MASSAGARCSIASFPAPRLAITRASETRRTTAYQCCARVSGLSGANPGGTRVLGAVAALVGALAQPAGCWELWRQRRHRLATAAGIAVAVVVLGVAVAWAGQLG